MKSNFTKHFFFSEYNEKTGDNINVKQIKKMWHNIKRPIKSNSVGQISVPSSTNPIEQITIAPSVSITRNELGYRTILPKP